MQCAVHNDPRPGRRKGIKQQKRNKEKKVYGQLRLKGRGGQLVCIGPTHGENATFFIIIIIIFLYLNTWTGSVVRFRHLQIEKELGRFRNRPSAQEQRRRLRNRTGEFGGLWKPTYIYTNGVCYISLILFDSGHWKERGGGDWEGGSQSLNISNPRQPILVYTFSPSMQQTGVNWPR